MNAESVVSNAIDRCELFKGKDIVVFTQGSYQNNTNVRRESDVDIAVVCYDSFFFDRPSGISAEQLGIMPATYDYVDFKDDLESALTDYLGHSAVHRGDKAFDVHETSYHVDCDVAPFFEHRRFDSDGAFISGVEMRSDQGSRIINWPQQHYENGVNKNTQTGRRYKSIVRILKALSDEMESTGRFAPALPSFLIECLVWNVLDDRFQNDEYRSDVRSVIKYLYNKTKDPDQCSEWGEVSEYKYLFRGTQKWTTGRVKEFTIAAWNYAQLGKDS